MRCLYWEGQVRGDKIGKNWHRSGQQCQDFLRMLRQTFAETQANACQHYILVFELHNKLKSRPDAKKWPPVPDTRKYHSIGNGQNGNLDVRTFLVVARVACRGMNLVPM